MGSRLNTRTEMEQQERHLNAFVPGPRCHVAGAAQGSLAGLTFAVKDLIDVAGVPTGGGNPDWQRAHPVPTRHAWIVERLLQSGARSLARPPPTRSPSAFWARTLSPARR